jgi:hypothetical protein
LCSNLDSSRFKFIGVGSGKPEGDRVLVVAIVPYYGKALKAKARMVFSLPDILVSLLLLHVSRMEATSPFATSPAIR